MSEKKPLHINHETILRKIYNNVRRHPGHFLEPGLCDSLLINCQELKLREDGLYDAEPSPCFFGHRVFVVKDHRQSSKMDDEYHQQQQVFYEMIEKYRADPSRQSAYICLPIRWSGILNYFRGSIRRTMSRVFVHSQTGDDLGMQPKGVKVEDHG